MSQYKELAIFDDSQQEIVAKDDVLYKTNDDGSMDRIGYKWLIDEKTSRYQYVLEPGDYAFSAKATSFARSTTRQGQPEPEILVKHFAPGECVSSTDYTEWIMEQNTETFSMTVTPDPVGTQIVAGSVADLTR